MNSFLYFILLLYCVSCSFADTISPRAFLGCAQVLTQIHCYGGLTGGYQQKSGSFINPTTDHFYMDLQNFSSNISNSDNSNNWTLVTGSNGVQLTVANSYMLATGISSNSKFVIYGGYGTGIGNGNSFLSNPLLMYDPPSNTWSALPTYGQYTILGAIADISAQQTLWTWGGRINNTAAYAQNQVFSLKYGVNQWTNQAGDSTNQNIRLSYTATLGNNGRIYIIGGFEAPALTTSSSNTEADMLSVRWYDTNSQSWGIDNATVSNGQSITHRAYHTTTQVPGSDSFLIYGGSSYIQNQNDVHADYAYLYDYTKSQYTPLSFNSTGAGRRSGHSAISYKNYIFILFGFNEFFTLQNDVNVLDVSNPNQPVWVTSQSSENPSGSSSSGTTSSSTGNVDPNTLSSGAIAGIAVGCALALVAFGVAIFFFIRHRQKKKKEQFQVDDLQPQHMADYMLPTHFPNSSGQQHGGTTAVNGPSYPSGDSQSHINAHQDEHTESSFGSRKKLGTIKPAENDDQEYNKPHGSE